MPKLKRRWKEYVASLTEEQKIQLLNRVFDHYIDDMGWDSDIAFREKDEFTEEECIYWTNSGESLLEDEK